MALDAVKNFAKATVSQGYDASATSIALTAGHGAKFPNPSTDGEFNLVWYNSTDYEDPADDPNVEIVRCTARSTDTLTITRNQESSGASTKNESGKTYKMILALTAKTITDIGQLRMVTPEGLINGINKSFELPSTPADTDVFFLFSAGIFMTKGADNTDYTISGTTITYVNAPVRGPMIAIYKE